MRNAKAPVPLVAWLVLSGAGAARAPKNFWLPA
jgi:hypothetical protein